MEGGRLIVLLSHTSSVSGRNKQVCCTALFPPAPSQQWAGPDSRGTLVSSHLPPSVTERSRTCQLHSSHFPPPPPLPLPSSSPPSCGRAQNDAGGVYHGGVRCPRSRPTGGGGRLGVPGRPLPTSQNSKIGGRSASLAGCFWLCTPSWDWFQYLLTVCRSELFSFCCCRLSHLSSVLIHSLLRSINAVFRLRFDSVFPLRVRALLRRHGALSASPVSRLWLSVSFNY